MFSIFRVIVHVFGVGIQICGCHYTGVNFFAFCRPLGMRKATVSFVTSACLSAHIRGTAHIRGNARIGGTRILLIFVEFLLNSLDIYGFIFK